MDSKLDTNLVIGNPFGVKRVYGGIKLLPCSWLRRRVPGPRIWLIVKEWKAQNGLKHYFNCASSPDLAIIENCFQAMKQHVRKYTHWDPDETQ
ncbi:hypothetical protein P152DRAFT_225948 [Eremomyces bilateralis CBS 781.70]|uniref:Uncharacterized protein n=1 Tax=Eremomyces bilateralis CBS 781.70 TaxID=1392243 RepID=A0A6G1FR76_9PEZI|nr:uncharacterized protein P152DRAFT_225948 [Eremomyces bilateralis CBS 781.70]KAF1808294.1 hypothetical protein P152DRAFT_225948 [Eremomyces bilateralis CBS 781.70]